MTQLTEADYEIDMVTLLSAIGVDPNTVVNDSTRLEFRQGKALLTYQVIRAVPPSLLAAGLLRGIHAPTVEPVEDDASETPRPARKRAAKKAAPK